MVYVMSDIHGQDKTFHEMLKKIEFSQNDMLYILGDVIDRGEGGINILQYIMSQSNIRLLIGNHEHMMCEYYRTGLMHDAALWMQNGGGVTYNAMEQLNQKCRIAILDYLKECPVVVPQLKVGNRMFYLTHAGIINRKTELLFKHAFIFDIDEAVWDRKFAINPKKNKSFEGYRVIFGHTITANLPYGRVNSKGQPCISYHKKAIAIDCGMANPKYGQLGCLRLDDMKEYYVKGDCKHEVIGA